LLERAEDTLKQNCTGMDYELHIAQLHDLLCHSVIGNLKVLSERLNALLQEAREQGDLITMTNLRAALAYLPTLARDQPDQARREVEAAIAAWSNRSFHLQHYHWLVSRVNIELYAGCFRTARQVLLGQWRGLRRSLLLSIQASRITMLELRARTALALTAEILSEMASDLAYGRPSSGSFASLVRDADHCIRAIRKERTQYGEALALKLLALRATLLGEEEDAKGFYFQAELGFDACGMALHSAAVRWSRGRLQGAPGLQVREAAEAVMREQGISNPARFATMHVPRARV